MRCVAVAAVLAAMIGCKKEAGFEGMKPADDWNAEQAGAVQKPMPQPRSFHNTEPRDDEQDEVPSDDNVLPQLPSPNPDRDIDPTHRVAGVIKLGPKAKGKAKPGTAVFVVAKHVDAAGNPVDPALAVAKLSWKDDLAFELTEVNAMIDGTQLTGDVVVTAHYDLDSEARTRQSGDILGQTRVTVPAENVKIVLDEVVP